MFLRVFSLFVLGLSANAAGASVVTTADRVLLVSCDGLRPDAIPATDTPVMQRLIETGSYQATALAELPPVTLPNHTSMVTGQSIANHGVLFNSSRPGRVSSQTIFDIAKAAGLSVGFFASKGKLSYLCEEGSVDVWRIVSNEDALTDDVIEAVSNQDLRLMFVHFGEPDGAGHRHGWMSETYLEQVARVDAALGRILDALDDKGVLDQTLVIVTSDHGGHDKTHFLNTPEDRFVPFILNGPDIAPGRVLCEQLRPMDAAATALGFLGLSTDITTDGKIVAEACIDFEQPPCEASAPMLGLPCGPLPALFLVPPVAMLFYRRRRS